MNIFAPETTKRHIIMGIFPSNNTLAQKLKAAARAVRQAARRLYGIPLVLSGVVLLISATAADGTLRNAAMIAATAVVMLGVASFVAKERDGSKY